jgi:CubicO group peptidase (beta-lactamase class C family)
LTSVENPLPVRPDTLFLVASVTKTFTATAVMRLVADGKVALDAPVRRYVPELVLADERAADQITVLNLLNHTSGLDWGVIGDFGEGNDALTRYVSALAGLPLIAPPGARPSYSQAGFNLAGRIVEKVTGLTYEKAVASLVFDPVGLSGAAGLPGNHRPGPGAAAVRRGARPGGGRPLRKRGHDLHRRDRRGRPGDGPANGPADGTADGGPD